MSISNEQMIDHFDLDLSEIENLEPATWKKPECKPHVYDYISLSNWLYSELPIAGLLLDALIEKYSKGYNGSLVYINLNNKIISDDVKDFIRTHLGTDIFYLYLDW